MSGDSSNAKPSAKSKMSRPSADEVRGDSATFENFMRKLVQVPHSEIKAELDAEKKMREQLKSSFSRVPRALSKRAN